MANLNKVMLIGNLTRDPELRHTPKGTAVAEIGLAINRVWNNDQGQKQEETTFVEVTFWGRQAELAQQYLTKGRPVYIEGRLQLDTLGRQGNRQKAQQTPRHRREPPVPVTARERRQWRRRLLRTAATIAPPPRKQRSGPPQGASAAPADDFQEDDDIPF